MAPAAAVGGIAAAGWYGYKYLKGEDDEEGEGKEFKDCEEQEGPVVRFYLCTLFLSKVIHFHVFVATFCNQTSKSGRVVQGR